MKSKAILGACLALTGVAGAVLAADAPKPIVPVFRVEFEPEDKFRALIFTDYFPGTAGQETIALTFNCQRSAPVGGMVTMTAKTRFTVRAATGGANLFTILPSVTSLPYPDPNDANNQCLGSNQTEYDEGDFPNTQNRGCPRDPGDGEYFGPSFDPNNFDGDACSTEVAGAHFNAGRATGSEGAQLIVFSDAITGSYRNASTGFNDVDVTNFAVHVYNTSGTRLWNKNFAGVLGAGRIEPVLSGVGDFLNDDGEDELRVARIADGEGSQTFRYYYYDIDTGAQIGSTVNVVVTVPSF